MKHTFIVPVLICLTLLGGCTTANHRTAENQAGVPVRVRLTSLLGMEGSERDARIYVNGRFVGHYEPDETTLALPAGRHVVVIKVPRVYSRQILASGATEVRTYALKAEESVEVLGAGSKQSLVFNSDNLEKEEIDDHDGP